MRGVYYFLAPPVRSDFALRATQGQSRCENSRLLSLNYIYKLAKQIIPLKPYLNTISFFLILIDPHLFFIETDCAHLPLERKKKIEGRS